MKESRLFRMLYYILDKGKVTAPELANTFEVSIRTIYRDIDVMSSAGIPIYAVQGKGGGIAISKDYVLDKLLLSKQEKEQILMSLQGIMTIGERNEEKLLYKLASLFQTKQINWIEVDFSNWTKGKVNQADFECIKEAIFDKSLLSFQYFKVMDNMSIRKIAPLKLVYKSMDWYVYGYCFLREEERFFKVSRMKNLHLETGEYPQDLQVPKSIPKDNVVEESVSLVLKFSKGMAFRVYDEVSDEIIEDEQGNFIVHTQLPNTAMLYSYIASFLDGVEVLEPAWIREELQKKIKKMGEFYKT